MNAVFKSFIFEQREIKLSVKKYFFLWNNANTLSVYIFVRVIGGFIMSHNTSSTASKHQEIIQLQSGQNWSDRQIKVLATQDPKRAMNIVIVKYRSCLLRIANRIVLRY